MPDLFSIARTNRFNSESSREPLPEAPPATLSHEQLVEEIISINNTATCEFLAQFDNELLGKYLDHLRFTRQPRCGKTGWERPGDAPAIMVRKRVV
ncbi:MAG: hypothetical protein JKY43_02045 [Phycisphaerales bacterium]|nr:hypothetical protein [Phycisphaerales bacterium]